MPVRETLPDRVVNEADEVIVVNLTPIALLNRIREGKVFPARDVPRALDGFFVPGNLDVLREMALLQVVEEIEARQVPARLLRRGDRLISGIRPERRERLLALVTPGAAGARSFAARGPPPGASRRTSTPFGPPRPPAPPTRPPRTQPPNSVAWPRSSRRS